MTMTITKSALGLLVATTLAACGGGSGTEPEQTLRVTVTNLTAGQPMSPLLLEVHTGPAAWTAGASASTALEHLAEGGDATALAAELTAAGGLAQVNGAAPLGPGASESHDISYQANAHAELTLAAMLVNTNDAFTGVAALPVGAMAVGDRVSRELPAWDAGTEANDETAATIPGPAGGGEGFNAARSDGLDAVRIHAGVVSGDDGLAGSVLKARHRFDNPVMKVEIERIR
jgi:hypothetical protein